MALPGAWCGAGGSPLAKFPGPKLAAVTLWYDFYYGVIRNGLYIREIEKMHAKYGSFC
jgi:hypothetical protein